MSAREQKKLGPENSELTAIFDYSKSHYPHTLQSVDHQRSRHVKKTYHQSKALACANDKKLTRTSKQGDQQTRVSVPNDILVLYDDGHLPQSRKNSNRFSPRPDSPRSGFFAKELNQFVDAGQSKVKRDNGFIRITRKT